jgi:tetratricopeptide (TPR) repeat protein
MPRISQLILFLCLTSISIFAQENNERFLEVKGTSELNGQSLAGATATLYEGTNMIKSVQTASDGTFSFKLDINKTYTIEVSKDGFVGKKITFNTTMPDQEKGQWMNEFSIGLIKPCDGVNYSLLKQPVDIVRFDPKKRQYVSDKDYVINMRPKIEELLTKSENCQMDKYDAAIKKGNQAMQQNNTEGALAAFQEAHEIFPDETYPVKQMNAIRSDANKQQKSVENAQKEKELDLTEQYNQAMAKASVAYTRKDYAGAQAYYKEALKLKPSEELPKTRMQEIETILAKKAVDDAKVKQVNDAYRLSVTKADSLMKVKNFDAARQEYAKALQIKPGESYPKAKSQEIDRIEEANARSAENTRKANEEKEYKALLDQADALLKAKSYDEAKAAYSKALAMRPNDPYPVQKVKSVENAMVAEKQKALENQSLQQYKSIVATADQQLQAKELDKARASYVQALALMPGDDYATSKVSTIDNMVAAEQAAKKKAADDSYKAAVGAANTALAQKQYAQASDFLKKALVIRPGDAYATGKQAEVDKLIAEQLKAKQTEENLNSQYKAGVEAADRLFNAGDLAGARKAYNDLFRIKPGDVYASQKISSIDDLVAAQLLKKQKETDDAYTAAMMQGSQSVVAKEYEKALESFRKALSLKPGDPSANSRISDTEKQIAEEQEMIAADKAKTQKYNDLIGAGDKLLAQKDYASAEQAYTQALNCKPSEQYPRQKLNEIASIEAEQERIRNEQQAARNAYVLSLENGDKFFKAKDYDRSKEEYTRAATLKPEEKLPKQRIEEINQLIKARDDEQARAKARSDAYTAAMNMGNRLLVAKDYTNARTSYQEALKVMPDDKLAKEQVARIDQLLASQKQAATKKEVTAEKVPEKTQKEHAVLGELVFKTESERDKYLEDLKKKYPAGITLEKYTEQYREVLRYIIIREDKAQEYRQVRFLTYNGYQYSVSGKPITQQYFLSQIKPREGESYKEIVIQ